MTEMTMQEDTGLLDRLMDAYVATPEEERRAFITRSIAEHPHFTARLADLHMASFAELDDDEPHPDDARMIEVATSRLHALYPVEAPSITSFTARARELKLNPLQFAARLRLGLDIVRKLDNRMIVPATVPPALVDTLAGLLQIGADQVTSFLAGGPRQQQAFYNAREAPVELRSEPFEDALQNSQMTTLDDRTYWRQQGA